MILNNIFKVSLAAAGLLAVAMPAQAGTFHGFEFDTEFTPDTPDPQADITLVSVTGNLGGYVEDFSLVTSAENHNLSNNTNGPSSTDCGDLVLCTPVEEASGSDIVDILGNLNLNKIVDIENENTSEGRTSFDIFFTDDVNTFYFWERGMNSDLMVEALDADGNVIGGKKIERTSWLDAGYDIDTTEINEAQDVGAYGLKLNTDVKGLRLSSEIAFNGPDIKVVATKTTPEPASIAALGLIAGSALLAKGRRKSA